MKPTQPITLHSETWTYTMPIMDEWVYNNETGRYDMTLTDRETDHPMTAQSITAQIEEFEKQFEEELKQYREGVMRGYQNAAVLNILYDEPIPEGIYGGAGTIVNTPPQTLTPEEMIRAVGMDEEEPPPLTPQQRELGRIFGDAKNDNWIEQVKQAARDLHHGK